MHQYIQHLFCVHPIDSKSCTSCKCALLIEARTIVLDDKQTDATCCNNLMELTYKELLDSFGNHFGPSLKQDMLLKLYQTKNTISGERLWEKVKDVCSELKTGYSATLSENIRTLPSVKQLQDIHKVYIVKNVSECIFFTLPYCLMCYLKTYTSIQLKVSPIQKLD